jgi:carbamoyltransferase
MSKIIGLSPTDGHDAGACLIIDGQVKYCLEEEKLTGTKACFNQNIFPEKAISSIAEKFGVTIENCDHIAIARPFVIDNFPQKYKAQEITNKIKSFSHHLCHAMGSYYTSGMDGKVISLSLDGAGLRSRGKIYLCEDNYYDCVHSAWYAIASPLANLWGFSANWMGWRILKDEGKIVGLAGHGKFNQKIYDYFSQCLYYEDLTHKKVGWLSTFFFILKKLSDEGWFANESKKADYAATLQKFTEDMMLKMLIDMKAKFPDYKKLCLSGGLFANVKLNQFINELDLYDEIYVHQAMGDAGLFLGAALMKASELGEINKPSRPENVYWGESFTKENWFEEMASNHNIAAKAFNLNYVANLINQGYVVGLFLGKTEYGPRALGNRSIVVRPTDAETHQKLNTRLKRTEIMPFAPSVLEGYANLIFECSKSKYTSEFMTICYNARPEWMDKIPAVVHRIDKSARPQIVKRSANQLYYDIIDEYRKISGFPIVLNTSFNAHGDPIINYPNQALKLLLDGSVDFIVTENLILYKE